MREDAANAYVVQPVAKALRVLAYVAEHGQLVSLKSVSEALGIPKTTAFRYLRTLARAGFLDHDAGTDRYVLGQRLRALARIDADVRCAREMAQPVLAELNRDYRGIVNVAAKGDGAVVYLDVVDAAAGFRTEARSGDSHPLHSTALGKAILAHLPPAEAQAYLARPLLERTGRTLIDRTELERQLRQIRRSGYALETGENEDGAMCIGAPILDAWDYPRVAISLTVPVARMSPDRAMQAGKRLAAAASSISRRLRSEQVPSTEVSPHGTRRD